MSSPQSRSDEGRRHAVEQALDERRASLVAQVVACADEDDAGEPGQHRELVVPETRSQVVLADAARDERSLVPLDELELAIGGFDPAMTRWVLARRCPSGTVGGAHAASRGRAGYRGFEFRQCAGRCLGRRFSGEAWGGFLPLCEGH